MRTKWHIAKVGKTATSVSTCHLLEFVAMNIPETLLRSIDGNQYVIVMTGIISKLTLAMTFGNTSSSDVANVVFYSLVLGGPLRHPCQCTSRQ